MIPTGEEIRRALSGAVQLAKGDPGGLGWFDVSFDGFWRSFGAMFVAAPGYAILLIEQYARTGWPEDPFGTIVAEAITYVAGWIAYPVVAMGLTRALGLSNRYVPLIVVSNWTAVLQVAFYTAVVVVTALMPLQLRTTLFLAATGAVLVYQWFTTKTALGSSGGVAAGFVAVDVLLSLLVSRSIDGLLHPA